MQEPLPMTIESSASKPSAAASPRPIGADWRIDSQTRRLGLSGVARARAALEACRSGHDQPNAA